MRRIFCSTCVEYYYSKLLQNRLLTKKSGTVRCIVEVHCNIYFNWDFDTTETVGLIDIIIDECLFFQIN